MIASGPIISICASWVLIEIQYLKQKGIDSQRAHIGESRLKWTSELINWNTEWFLSPNVNRMIECIRSLYLIHL